MSYALIFLVNFQKIIKVTYFLLPTIAHTLQLSAWKILGMRLKEMMSYQTLQIIMIFFKLY